ncbi:TPA: CRISPR system precrRNA processing endoribonuclease RAMP protein Cas6 [Campylobacter lari]|nr:CRISPR system precrRNA processing endoribonuclease RAMP protein Cas6 [Campylobacter lari]
MISMCFCKISVLFKSKNKPPYFIGSQLRGALGYALKDVACKDKSKICQNCEFYNNCVYYRAFEEKNSYHKYRLDFELNKPYYDFNLYVFDDECEYVFDYISAIHKMLTEFGIGENREIINDFSIYVNDEKIYQNNHFYQLENYIDNINLNTFSKNIELILLTPLRIKKNNVFIRDMNIELLDIINSIQKRYSFIYNQANFKINLEGKIVSKNLSYQELNRKSNRQNTKMQLGGLIGTIKIQDLNHQTYKLLKIGEYIGVGKQCVFGLGKIIIKEENE